MVKFSLGRCWDTRSSGAPIIQLTIQYWCKDKTQWCDTQSSGATITSWWQRAALPDDVHQCVHGSPVLCANWAPEPWCPVCHAPICNYVHQNVYHINWHQNVYYINWHQDVHHTNGNQNVHQSVQMSNIIRHTICTSASYTRNEHHNVKKNNGHQFIRNSY